MQDESSFFYMTLFDNWSKDPAQRGCAPMPPSRGSSPPTGRRAFVRGQHSHRRPGPRPGTSGGDLDTSHYAEAARRGYLHLRGHNLAYLDDGVENIIDDYCACWRRSSSPERWAPVARRGAGQGGQAVRPPAPSPGPGHFGPPTTMARALLPRRRGGPAGAGAAGVSRHRAGSRRASGAPRTVAEQALASAGPRGPGRQSPSPWPASM